MKAEEVRALVEAGIEHADVAVQGEGDRFEIRVVSEAFSGLMPVKKQQMVYACINDCISNGDIHAVSIHSYTPEEWEKAQKMGLA